MRYAVISSLLACALGFAPLAQAADRTSTSTSTRDATARESQGARTTTDSRDTQAPRRTSTSTTTTDTRVDQMPRTSAWPVSLTWQIPSRRENGAALRMSDLAGYELYYVSQDESRSGVVAIDSPDQSSHVLELSEPGTYYFAIAAIDRRGAKSKLSKMVQAEVGR